MHAGTRALVSIIVLGGLVACPAGAAERRVQGKKLLFKDLALSESTRSALILGVEKVTDVPSIIGNPTTSGATLHVIVNGTTTSDETYVLDAGGWHVLGTVGYKYLGPTGGDGDPVKLVIIKRTPSARTILKVLLNGALGTQSLDLVPPNTGLDAGMTLAIGGGDSYCVAFGSLAGGTATVDNATQWKIVNTNAQPGCPVPSGTPTACCNLPLTGPGGSVSACFDTIVADAGVCTLLGGTPGGGGTVCNANGGSEACGAPKTVGAYCCQCPAPIGAPHATYCFDTSNGSAYFDCALPCTIDSFGAACGAVTGSCGGF